MSDIRRVVTNRRRGRAAVYNGMAFIGGQAADDRDLDIRGQTEQALCKLDRVLDVLGSSRNHLLYAQIWLKNIERDFLAMNEVWDGWISPEAAPARATAQCELAHPDVLVEITAIAAASSVISSSAHEGGNAEKLDTARQLNVFMMDPAASSTPSATSP